MQWCFPKWSKRINCFYDLWIYLLENRIKIYIDEENNKRKKCFFEKRKPQCSLQFPRLLCLDSRLLFLFTKKSTHITNLHSRCNCINVCICWSLFCCGMCTHISSTFKDVLFSYRALQLQKEWEKKIYYHFSSKYNKQTSIQLRLWMYVCACAVIENYSKIVLAFFRAIVSLMQLNKR